MKTKLYSIVSFVAVAPNETVSLPHGLNLNDGADPIIPDELKRRTTGIFTVTADDINVTVTNEGSEADIDVLSEHWHSIERQLGGGVSNLPIQPWETENDGLSDNGAMDFQWSPDAPGDKLLPGRIFDGFKDCFDACVAARELGFTDVTMHFDRSYSLTLDVNGQKTCRVPTSAVDGTLSPTLGVKVWDITGINVGGGWSVPGGTPSATGAGVNISFDDGAIFQPVGGDDINLTFKEGILHNDSATHIPIRPAPNWGFLIAGGPQVRIGADLGALPLWAPDPDAGFVYYASGQNGNGGIGYGGGSPSPAAIIDSMGIAAIISAEGTCNILDSESFTDSVGGGSLRLRGPWRNDRANDGPADHPGLGEVLTGTDFRNGQFFNLKTPVMTSKSSNANVLFGDGDTLTPGVCYCDTSGGDITVKMPCFASPISGTNVMVVPVGGGKVTVDPFDAANVRNVAGVADTVDSPDVLTATRSWFISNGGMDGTSIGRWERFI